jgi:hypothetical protein
MLSVATLSDLIAACGNGSFDLRRPFAMGLPLSDPKSVAFKQFRGWRSVKLVTLRTVIPRTSPVLSMVAAAYAIGLGALKRAGQLDQVKAICDSMLARCRPAQLQAIALSNLADLLALKHHFRRAMQDEHHLRLEGILAAPITRNTSLLLSGKAELSDLEQAERYLLMAIEESPDWLLPKYQLATLLLLNRDPEEGFRLFKEVAFQKSAGSFFRQDYLALAPIFEESSSEAEWQSRARRNTLLVQILERHQIKDALGSELVAASAETSIRLKYDVFHSFESSTRVEKTLIIPTVHVIAPTSTTVQAGAWPSIIIDDQFMLKSFSAYDGVQFGIFDKPMLAVGGSWGLRSMHSTPTHASEKSIVLWGYADNYYHFVFDCLGSLAFYSDDQIQDAEQIIVAGFSPELTGFQRQLAGLIGPPISSKLRKLHERAPDLVMPRCLLCTNPNLLNVPHPAVVAFLRNRLFDPHETRSSPRSNLFVGRSDRRRLDRRKHRRFFEFLERNEFLHIDPAMMSVEEQRKTFAHARVIVFEAGAAVTNLLFCPSDSHAILLTSEFGYRDIFAALAGALGIGFSVVLSPNASFYPRALLCWSEVWLDLDESSAMAAVAHALDDCLTEVNPGLS